MPHHVLTPISQALADGILTRRELKALMRRSNRPAFTPQLPRSCVEMSYIEIRGGLTFTKTADDFAG